MSLVTIASDTVTADVIGGTIHRPLIGVWTADLVIDQPDGSGFPGGAKVTIKSQDGYALTGVVAQGRTGDFLDAVHVRVVGGAGGMPTVVTARSYVQPGAFVSDVLNGLCGDSGETLSDTIDESLLSQNLAAWSVKAEPTSYALTTLIGWVSPSLSWRVLSDGTLWVGNETWPSAAVTYDLLSQDPKDAAYELGLQSPALEPGTTVDGIGQVSRAEIEIKAASIRARVWTPVTDPARGTNSDLEALINLKTSHVDYYALYVYEVISQSGDLTTVDVSPVGERNKALLGGLQRVPVRCGTGIKIQFVQGAHVLLGWDGGNPEGPFVLAGLSGDSATSIQLGGNTPVAREGDTCDGGTLVFFPGTGAATLAYIPPGGIVTPPTPPTINIPLAPKINSGSSIVGAG